MNTFALSPKCYALVGFFGLVASPSSQGQSQAETEKALVMLQNDWGEARIKGDVAFLETFYAKELKLTVMTGSVIDRNADIALFASRAIRPEAIKDEDLKVSVYGETAVMTGLERLKGTYNGHTGEVALRFTNVLIQRDGRWQLVAHQATEVTNLPGQTVPANGVYQQGPGVVMPKIIHFVEASFTDEARKRKINADVRIQVVVDADGRLGEPHVIKSAASKYSDPDDRDAALTLDQKAIEAVRQYTFDPGTFHDKPVPVLVTVEVTFNLH
jgi:TonB family protein